MIFPARNLHLLGIFHGYVSHGDYVPRVGGTAKLHQLEPGCWSQKTTATHGGFPQPVASRNIMKYQSKNTANKKWCWFNERK